MGASNDPVRFAVCADTKRAPRVLCHFDTIAAAYMARDAWRRDGHPSACVRVGRLNAAGEWRFM